MILLKLHLIGKLSNASQQICGDGESRKFRQANRSSLGILITSLFFLTVPSIGVGFMEMIGYSIFKKIGPFYTVGLLCAGTSNSIIYIVLNRDMRKHAKNMVSESVGSPTTKIFQPSFNK
ncbi:hypothetical protein OESDEN_16904 [Oesophagostomum dentatum]|uniref:Uncharacterized protein n=1 Tax=Oesophagostomum dentatum TaxID=61180 RepID=A0A0B1SEN2_OESDE|nr:hypothetical protein OESDEN_16904 [Oesophagostomum dentatum]